MFALHPSTPSRLRAGAARSDVRQSLTAVCSRTGTGGGGPLASSENRRGGAKLREPYREHRRMRTSAELPCVLINSHQITPPTPFPTLGGSFCPPPPSGPPSPSNPCWLWTPWTGPREKAKLPGSLLRCPIDLIVFSAGHVWGTLGGLLPQLCKAWGVPFLPNLHNNIIPNSSAFCQLFPSISPQPNH